MNFEKIRLEIFISYTRTTNQQFNECNDSVEIRHRPGMNDVKMAKENEQGVLCMVCVKIRRNQEKCLTNEEFDHYACYAIYYSDMAKMCCFFSVNSIDCCLLSIDFGLCLFFSSSSFSFFFLSVFFLFFLLSPLYSNTV